MQSVTVATPDDSVEGVYEEELKLLLSHVLDDKEDETLGSCLFEEEADVVFTIWPFLSIYCHYVM